MDEVKDAGAETPRKRSWDDFVSEVLVELFQSNKLRSLTAEDEDGNKVKMKMCIIEKEDTLKIEKASITYQ